MNKLLERLGGKLKGMLQGFDRIVFKGYIQPLLYPAGAMSFCRGRGILNKEYKDWMLGKSQQIVKDAEEYVRQECGEQLSSLATYTIRKEEVAHAQQDRLQIQSGLIGGWSCVESCRSYRARYDAQAGYPQLSPYATRCKHIYFYLDHSDYGFMSLRLQTWFPYSIQIALNGREWLRRSLQKEGIEAVFCGNKLYDVGNLERAQQLLTAQLDTRWVELLNGFVPIIFPSMNQIVEPFSYTWTLWQSEWATDLLLPIEVFEHLSDPLLRHAWLTGSSQRVLRYMGKSQKGSGWPAANARPELKSRCQPFYEGLCVRHWWNQNSIKMYNEQHGQTGVIRMEVTMNNPGAFQVHRHKQGQSKQEAKQLLPMRKGIADIALRAEVSKQITDRFADQQASFRDQRPLHELIDQVTRRFSKDGRKVRALDLFGKDRELLLSISDPTFCIDGMTNKQLREKMKNTPWAKGKTDKQRAGKVTRQLRLLRDHGLLCKVKKQNRYMLTEKGKLITTALGTILSASIDQLVEKAA